MHVQATLPNRMDLHLTLAMTNGSGDGATGGQNLVVNTQAVHQNFIAQENTDELSTLAR